jgi:hypothetical protein
VLRVFADDAGPDRRRAAVEEDELLAVSRRDSSRITWRFVTM